MCGRGLRAQHAIWSDYDVGVLAFAVFHGRISTSPQPIQPVLWPADSAAESAVVTVQ